MSCLRDYYGASTAGELASECESGHGLHIMADRTIMETVNPGNLQMLGPGKRES